VTNNYHLFFLDYNAQLTSLAIYGGSVIGVLLLGIIVEMLQFIKWYLIVRKRITTNCLISLVVDLHKDQQEVKQMQRKIRLSVCERIIVTLVHFLSKGLHFFVLYLIMATYNIGYIVGSSAGYMMGNLVFGLIKDSIVITRVKKEKKEIETKRKQMVEVLHKRRTSMMFVPGGVARSNSHQTLDTERGVLKD
jgi:hypothetical protein